MLIKYSRLSALDNGADAHELLQKCLHLSEELNDSSATAYTLEMLSAQCNKEGKYNQALAWAKKCLEQYSTGQTELVYCDLATAYAKTGFPDSAQQILDNSHIDFIHVDEQTAVCYYYALSDIAESLKDYYHQARYDAMGDSISNRLVTSPVRGDLVASNQQYEETKIEKLNEELYSRGRSTKYLLLFVLAIILVLAYHYKRQRSKTAREVEQMRAQLNDSTLTHLQHFAALSSSNQQLHMAVMHHIDVIKGLIESSQKTSDRAFQHQFMEAVQVGNDERALWTDSYLDDLADASFGGIITHLKHMCPDLTRRELSIIDFVCFDFSKVSIAAILGYKTADSLRMTYRRIQKKLKTDRKLVDYLTQLKATLRER